MRYTAILHIEGFEDNEHCSDEVIEQINAKYFPTIGNKILTDKQKEYLKLFEN